MRALRALYRNIELSVPDWPSTARHRRVHHPCLHEHLSMRSDERPLCAIDVVSSSTNSTTHKGHLSQRCLASTLKFRHLNMRTETTEHICRQTRPRALITEADCVEYSTAFLTGYLALGLANYANAHKCNNIPAICNHACKLRPEVASLQIKAMPWAAAAASCSEII